MRFSSVPVAAISLVAVGACSAFGASANEPAPVTAEPERDSGGITVTQGDASEAKDADALVDAGDAATGPRGRRSIACGDDAGTCTGESACCINPSLPDLCLSPQCRANDIVIACDDTADCPSGQVCCAEKDDNDVLRVVNCRPTCAPTKYNNRVCNPNNPSECTDNRGCVSLQMAFGSPVYGGLPLYGCK